VPQLRSVARPRLRSASPPRPRSGPRPRLVARLRTACASSPTPRRVRPRARASTLPGRSSRAARPHPAVSAGRRPATSARPLPLGSVPAATRKAQGTHRRETTAARARLSAPRQADLPMVAIARQPGRVSARARHRVTASHPFRASESPARRIGPADRAIGVRLNLTSGWEASTATLARSLATREADRHEAG
jgi:hypothetical protein